MGYNVIDADTGEILIHSLDRELIEAVALYIKRLDMERNIWVI